MFGRERAARRPKIVFVNRYFYPDQSATSQMLTDLASSLVQSGFRVEVICSRQHYDDPGVRLAPRESVAGVAVHRVWTSRFGRHRLFGRSLDYTTFYASSALQMLRLLKRGDIIVAKTDPPLISIVAMLVARLKGAFLINWLQDIFPEVASVLGANPLPSAADALLRRCRDVSLRAAHVNIVLGERMREKLQTIGIPLDNIKIIENWAELHPGKPKPAAESLLRSRLGLTDEFVVGYSGNLGRAHEFHTLLGAAELMKADPQVIFLMIGGGAGMRLFNQEVKDRGLTNFRFLPYQTRESLGDCLAAADVHWVSLQPALEGLIVPSKFYGILAAARPVIFIGDPDGELARDIRRGGCGAAVNVGDVTRLTSILESWKRDAERRRRMGDEGHRRYSDRYSAQRAFDQWISVLRPHCRVDGASPPVPSNQ